MKSAARAARRRGDPRCIGGRSHTGAQCTRSSTSLRKALHVQSVHLHALRRARGAGLPWPRRACRVLAIAPWDRGGAFFADSTRPNTGLLHPGSAEERSFGSSPPTRRPCAILVWPASRPSPAMSPLATPLTPRVRLVCGIFSPPRARISSSVVFAPLLLTRWSRPPRARRAVEITITKTLRLLTPRHTRRTSGGTAQPPCSRP